MSLIYNLDGQWMLDVFGTAVIVPKQAFLDTLLAAALLGIILAYGYGVNKVVEYRQKQVAELRRAVQKPRPVAVLNKK